MRNAREHVSLFVCLSIRLPNRVVSVANVLICKRILPKLFKGQAYKAHMTMQQKLRTPLFSLFFTSNGNVVILLVLPFFLSFLFFFLNLKMWE